MHIFVNIGYTKQSTSVSSITLFRELAFYSVLKYTT